MSSCSYRFDPFRLDPLRQTKLSVFVCFGRRAGADRHRQSRVSDAARRSARPRQQMRRDDRKGGQPSFSGGAYVLSHDSASPRCSGTHRACPLDDVQVHRGRAVPEADPTGPALRWMARRRHRRVDSGAHQRITRAPSVGTSASSFFRGGQVASATVRPARPAPGTDQASTVPPAPRGT